LKLRKVCLFLYSTILIGSLVITLDTVSLRGLILCFLLRKRGVMDFRFRGEKFALVAGVRRLYLIGLGRFSH